jgi:hypothetical protein
MKGHCPGLFVFTFFLTIKKKGFMKYAVEMGSGAMIVSRMRDRRD